MDLVGLFESTISTQQRLFLRQFIIMLLQIVEWLKGNRTFKFHPVHSAKCHIVCIAGPTHYCGGNSAPDDSVQYFESEILLVDVCGFSI
jgi:hypothetical protein